MIAEPFGGSERVLARVQEGMPVTDYYGERVGKVKQVYLGGEDLSAAQGGADSVLTTVPVGLRSRLATTGFVEIATGLLHPNRYATGAQVERVDAAGVHLTVGEDDLPKK